jgi:hypothetical protein
VKDDRTKERFRHWLSTNAQFWSAEVRLVSILEPLWFRDIPYSAAQARRTINEQGYITAQACRDMAIYCQEVRNDFKGICLSYDVLEGHINAGTIVDYARNWHSDCILLLSSKKNTLQELLRLSIPAQVLRAAECMVLVVQASGDQKAIHQVPNRRPSTI